MRVALLGLGGIAPRHVAAIKSLGHDLIAGVGRDPARTQAFVDQHGGEPFIELDAMIDRTAPDLLIATLPPFARDGEIEHAASRGVHLLVEKPIALDIAAAEAMTAAVQRAGVIGAVGFMYRHGDAVKAWRVADTGLAGLYAGAYHCNALHAAWWREQAKSGGQMLEQVIHQVDLVRYLMGDPDTVYARRANLFHGSVVGYDIEDVSAIVFGWDDGRIATLNASNAATPGVWHKEWQIYAERMTGRFSSWNEAIFTPTAPDASPVSIFGDQDPFAAQLADVIQAIEERRAPLVTLRGATDTLRLALAARQSADESREIRLSDA